MEGWRWLAVLVVGLALSAILYTQTPEASIRVYDMLSCSPENPGPGGTSQLRLALAHEYGEVVLAESVDRAREGGLYVIIGPDKQFTQDEARELARLARAGTINLLIADETQNTRLLLAELGLPFIDGLVVDEAGEGEWQYVVAMTCMGETVVTTKAARLSELGGGEPLCYYTLDGSLAAALYTVGQGRVLVIGDSSIFANFLFRGAAGFPQTRDVALELVRLAAGDKTRVVIDNAHYDYRPAGTALGAAVSGIAASAARGLESLADKAREASWYWLAAVFLAAVLPWPAILWHPVREGPPWEDPVDRLENVLLELEALRLGLPAESSVEEILEEAGAE